MIELGNRQLFRYGLDRLRNPMVLVLGFWALTAVFRLLSLITFLGFVVSDTIALVIAILLISDYQAFGFVRSKKWICILWQVCRGQHWSPLLFLFFIRCTDIMRLTGSMHPQLGCQGFFLMHRHMDLRQLRQQAF